MDESIVSVEKLERNFTAMSYVILALVATIIGAVVGIGGGLIMRPMLGIMGVAKDLASFTSAIAVFFMAISNLITHHRRGTKIELKGTIPLAIGSIIGGFSGGALLKLVSSEAINIGYIFVLILILVAVLGRPYLKPFKVKNPIAQMAIGLVTGSLSGLFGIGGGPLQVAALLLFFNMPAKEAAVQSVLITLLTTSAALLRYTMDGYASFSIAMYMVPAAIIGGLLGSIFNRKFSNRVITIIFCAVIAIMLVMQVVAVV